MKRGNVRLGALAGSALLVAVSFAACSSAPQKDLWYVHFGAQCPPPNTGVDTNNPAGFTSYKAAKNAARIETQGPRIYWQQHLMAAQQELTSARSTPHFGVAARVKKIAAAQALVSEYTSLLAGYAHCTKYVVKGVPPKH